jgi:hypothetical protein
MTTKRRESVFAKMAKVVTPLPGMDNEKALISPRSMVIKKENDVNVEDLKVSAVEILKTSKKSGYLTKQGLKYSK